MTKFRRKPKLIITSTTQRTMVSRNLFILFDGFQRSKPYMRVRYVSFLNANISLEKDKWIHEEQLKNPLQTLHIMEQQGIPTDSNIYALLFQECAETCSPNKGKLLHAHSIIKGIVPTVFMSNHLVNMYAKCGNIEDARKVFDKIPVRNMYSWNTMIAGYVKCGSLHHAHDLFEKMPQRNVVSWNTIISGCGLNGQGKEALNLFCEMREKGIDLDHFTCSSVISVCAELKAIPQGKQVHSYVTKAGFDSHVSVNNALVTMYVKYEDVEDACQLFAKMPERNEISWNAMIVGFAQHRLSVEALELFDQMVGVGLKPDHFTMASVLTAFANLEDLHKGIQFHAHIIVSDYGRNAVVGCALVDMYAKCGSIAGAQKVFERLHARDTVVWNSMLSGYSQNDYCEDALKLFTQMRRKSVKPDECSFVCLLSVCGGLAALELGEQIHALLMRTEFGLYVSVGNALITMYSKCGCIEVACYLFNKMPKRDVVSCNAMIAGHAQHGCGKEALEVLEKMLDEGSKPTHVTFIAVLSACSHTGLVDEGRRYFESMSQHHCISPTVDHYNCMIDLLGRAGQFEEVENLIRNMPFDPGAVGWAALLGACRSHGNVELGSHAADRLLKLEPENAASYVMLANMYAAADKWNDVTRVRRMMKDKGVKKKPGCSWIEINKKVHAFVAGDRSHPQMKEIYATLEILASKLKEAGYVPDTRFSLLHDTEEEQKGHTLSHDCEKSALAFG
ncbi:pentatricopeptide repeat-containing protein At3g49710 [Cryptomeria japonica]|uniref:pentatricopeptide repeat-containing protein At3g49710 n=1 Tax=Cryptomeria japonica TaxID=3369 RepID=UPI0027DA7955|nr:pentatricopeptide repeat-containing protein At3g49710 [Cryptomeria japonica]